VIGETLEEGNFVSIKQPEFNCEQSTAEKDPIPKTGNLTDFPIRPKMKKENRDSQLAGIILDLRKK